MVKENWLNKNIFPYILTLNKKSSANFFLFFSEIAQNKVNSPII